MNTIEEKRLIATFMNYAGGKPLTDGLLLSLYNDWNSVMLVVEKIESIEDEHRCAKYNVIIEQSWCEIIDNNSSDIISQGDANDKIIAVYGAVVEFIKYYNNDSTRN